MTKLADRLTVPVNPAHVLGSDDEQSDYVNPVTLNNYQVTYANSMIELTDASVAVNKKLEAVRDVQRKAVRALEDLEDGVLRLHPVPPSYKTVKQQQAWIGVKAADMKLSERRDSLTAQVRECEDQIAGLKADAWHAELWIKAVAAASDYARTHLSYVKDEAKRARFGT